MSKPALNNTENEKKRLAKRVGKRKVSYVQTPGLEIHSWFSPKSRSGAWSLHVGPPRISFDGAKGLLRSMWSTCTQYRTRSAPDPPAQCGIGCNALNIRCQWKKYVGMRCSLLRRYAVVNFSRQGGWGHACSRGFFRRSSSPLR